MNIKLSPFAQVAMRDVLAEHAKDMAPRTRAFLEGAEIPEHHADQAIKWARKSNLSELAMGILERELGEPAAKWFKIRHDSGVARSAVANRRRALRKAGLAA